jgi:hypothetical protein
VKCVESSLFAREREFSESLEGKFIAVFVEGQNRKSRPCGGMSALPPGERTWSGCLGMSEKCSRKRTCRLNASASSSDKKQL